jgi:hypothetical protein
MNNPKTAPDRPVERAAALSSSNIMSWFVPPLVVPALMAALLFAWMAYQAYS